MGGGAIVITNNNLNLAEEISQKTGLPEVSASSAIGKTVNFSWEGTETDVTVIGMNLHTS